MATRGYKYGVVWAAKYDGRADRDVKSVATGYVSTLLLAALFGKAPMKVAKAIVSYRKYLAKEDSR